MEAPDPIFTYGEISVSHHPGNVITMSGAADEIIETYRTMVSEYCEAMKQNTLSGERRIKAARGLLAELVPICEALSNSQK